MPEKPAVVRTRTFRRLPRSRRGWSLLVLGVLLFIAISVVLARWLQVENIERDDDVALIEAETKGSVPGMLADLDGCRQSPACVSQVKANAANKRLRRRGSVKVLQLESQTAYSLTGASGKTRVAWTVIGSLPVVQCVEVRRSGNALKGIHVSLLSLSAPIQNEADC